MPQFKNWIVYNENTTSGVEQFVRYGDAQRKAASLNRAEKRHGKWARSYKAVHVDFWREYILHKISVRNIISGEWVEYWSDTPFGIRVDSETYWSS